MTLALVIANALDMADHLARAAEVPAHKDPSRAPDDFVALNKALRSCFVCRLVKSEKQVRNI